MRSRPGRAAFYFAGKILLSGELRGRGGENLSVIDVLKEFQGIIGTLLGVAITLFMTKWLESWGKTRYYFSKIDVTYSKKR